MPEERADFDYESYAAGYRAAVCDMHPVPVPLPPKQNGTPTLLVLAAYLLGVLVAYTILKWE